MSKIIDRAGSGAALTAAENDANLSSLSGINEDQSGTTHTIDIDDQNKTITYSNAGTVTVTLTLLSTIAGALHTDDYRVILKSLGAGGVTINTNAADTFDDTTTSQTLAQYEVIELQSSNTATIWNIIRKRQLVVPATTNNLAMLDANGELADSLVESDSAGNITANVTGNLTGNVTGNVTGDITSTGTSSIDDLTVVTTLSIPAGSIGAAEISDDAVRFSNEMNNTSVDATWAVNAGAYQVVTPAGVYNLNTTLGTANVEYQTVDGWIADKVISTASSSQVVSDGTNVRVGGVSGTNTVRYRRIFS